MMQSSRRYDTKSQGTIRVQSQSPYEYLDPESEKWLIKLKAIWPMCKNSETTCKLLHNFFTASRNPYVSALQAMITSGDFYTGKQNSLSSNIMENFWKWTELNNKSHLYLNDDIKYDAFDLVIQQKNQSLITLVVKTYKMLESKEIFIPQINNLISLSKYKEACQCAVVLELFEHFTIDKFVIPLVFQDKYVVAEKFLEGSKQHQISLVTFLDELLGKKNIKAEADTSLRQMNITGVNTSHFYSKPLGKLISRIIKSFNLPLNLCPNLMKKRGKGALQFLLNKRYIENTISGDSWTEMILEAVGDVPNLQLELVEGISFFLDFKEALNWAEKFGIPQEQWPFTLKEYYLRLKSESSLSVASSEEARNDVKDKSVLKFHKLPIPDSQIFLIDKPGEFLKFLDDISHGVDIVGFDAEWKPSFGFKKCHLALIQIAIYDAVYILDVIALTSAPCQVLWERFVNVLLANSNIIKLGFGVESDLVIVKESLSQYHGIKTSDAGFLDLAVLWRILVHNFNFVFPYASAALSNTSKSLNSLIELCIGEKLDKSDQFSNWENRPLRKSQIIYAATDGYCLLEAYDVILKESKLQNIPFSEVLSYVLNKTTSNKILKIKRAPDSPKQEENTIEATSGDRQSIVEFKIVCDSMLEPLGKELRKCGVDTDILQKEKDAIERIMAEPKPVVFTQIKNQNELKKYGKVYGLKSTRLREQYYEVFEILHAFEPENVSSRCMECNCNEFTEMTQDDIISLMRNDGKTSRNFLPAEEFVEENSCEFYEDDLYECADDDEWFSDSNRWSSFQEPLHYSPNRTRRGVLIRFETIPPSVLRKVPVFWICVECGNCYWEGSHKSGGVRKFRRN